MGRTIEFNYDRAIANATNLFWKKGYSNTSLRELLKVMKVGEGSFYHLIKSKKNLYIECLKHYNNTVTARRLNILTSEPSVKKGLRNFFEAILDELDNPKTPRICLMAGSLSTDVLEVSSFENYVIGEMIHYEEHIIARFELAKENKELPEHFHSKVAAQIIITYLQGLFRVIRILQTHKEMSLQVDTLLTSLGI